MKYLEITKDDELSGGEYLLHVPTNTIVICGQMNLEQGTIRVLSRHMREDSLENFRRIASEGGQQQPHHERGCGGCKGW